MSADRPNDGALAPDELAAQQAADLPAREVMTLLDPNAVGGTLLSSPTPAAGDATQAGSTDPTTGATQPADSAAQTATQTSSEGTQLASGYLPDATQAAGATYQPSVSSTAQS